MPATVFSYDENYLMVIDVYILEVQYVPPPQLEPEASAGADKLARLGAGAKIGGFTGIPWSGSTGHKSGGAEGHAEPPVGQIIQYSRARVAYPYSMECMLNFMFAVNILTLFSVITSPYM